MIAKSIAAALTVSLLAISTMALADKGGKPDKARNNVSQDYRNDGNAHGERRGERHDGHKGSSDRQRADFHFGDRDRAIIRDYYGAEIRGGHCPPGLAKKRNGCMPPGQTKKWIRGKPLPHDVVYYELPRELLVRLPPPPAGRRYVRVAEDVLLIAIGSSMVVDAIQDILR